MSALSVSVSFRCTLIVAAICIATATAASAQGTHMPGKSGTFAADTLSDGTVVPNKPAPPQLHLTDAQRAQIRAAVDKRSSEVDFPLGTAQAGAKFEPEIGAKVPAKMKGQTLPVELTRRIPALRQYTYVKMPDKAVIVDPLSHKVAAVVSLP